MPAGEGVSTTSGKTPPSESTVSGVKSRTGDGVGGEVTGESVGGLEIVGDSVVGENVGDEV